jgi:hypothetical protein
VQSEGVAAAAMSEGVSAMSDAVTSEGVSDSAPDGDEEEWQRQLRYYDQGEEEEDASLAVDQATIPELWAALPGVKPEWAIIARTAKGGVSPEERVQGYQGASDGVAANRRGVGPRRRAQRRRRDAAAVEGVQGVVRGGDGVPEHPAGARGVRRAFFGRESERRVDA